MFVDLVEIEIEAGAGGNGIISFRREKHIAKGGPNGGDGGRGGNVVLEVDDNLMTLMDLKYRQKYSAKRGADGQGSLKTGKSGEDIVIRVPPGTAVYDADDPENLLVDLVKPGEQYTAATGGKGGLGNAHFKSPTNQAPRKATPGKPGEKRRLILELRLIADVGLVGYPNAGKSTMLAAVSRAKPKIADYPFTTLSPNLGIVEVAGYKQFRMADIPGIIEGASLGKGLGHDFLRHIMRTKVLLFVIDGSSDAPAAQYAALRKELIEFDWRLGEKPYVIALNKIDLISGDDIDTKRNSVDPNSIPTSGKTKEGMDRLKAALWKKIEEYDD